MYSQVWQNPVQSACMCFFFYGSQNKQQFLDALAKLRNAAISFVMSVRPLVRSHRTPDVPLNGFWLNLIFYLFVKNQSRIFKFYWHPTWITGTLQEDVFTFMVIFRWILLTMRGVSIKSCRENQNTHFMFGNFFFFWKSCRLWDNVKKPGVPRETADNMVCIAFWIKKATWAKKHTSSLAASPTPTPIQPPTHARTYNTHKYVVFVAFSRAQWFAWSVGAMQVGSSQSKFGSLALYLQIAGNLLEPGRVRISVS
jgi:hypothetical protein